MNAHLTDEQLINARFGIGADSDEKAVEAHLASCEECRARDARLAATLSQLDFIKGDVTASETLIADTLRAARLAAADERETVDAEAAMAAPLRPMLMLRETRAEYGAKQPPPPKRVPWLAYSALAALVVVALCSPVVVRELNRSVASSDEDIAAAPAQSAPARESALAAPEKKADALRADAPAEIASAEAVAKDADRYRQVGLELEEAPRAQETPRPAPALADQRKNAELKSELAVGAKLKERDEMAAAGAVAPASPDVSDAVSPLAMKGLFAGRSAGAAVMPYIRVPAVSASWTQNGLAVEATVGADGADVTVTNLSDGVARFMVIPPEGPEKIQGPHALEAGAATSFMFRTTR